MFIASYLLCIACKTQIQILEINKSAQYQIYDFITGRVINVISHCAYLSLPGISIYGATKSAVRAWSVGLRVELESHGVQVITFLPGR